MTTALELKNVDKSFGSKKVLDGVSLNVEKGQIFGFLGPNGAGKTTTIRCILDYIRPTNGQITILGKDAQQNAPELKNKIGYLSGDMHLHENWTAKTHLEFVTSIKGTGRTTELVKEFGLDLGVKVRNLSTGNKQKLAIILAFVGNPKLLIMDEPTRGLDPLLQNQLYALLRNFVADGGTVFFSSHNLTEVQQLCDRVAVIRDGKIVASEAMKDLLSLQLHTVKATASKAIKKEDFTIEGTEVIRNSGKSIELKVKGHIDLVTKALAQYPLTELEVLPADLEDVFMEYY